MTTNNNICQHQNSRQDHHSRGDQDHPTAEPVQAELVQLTRDETAREQVEELRATVGHLQQIIQNQANATEAALANQTNATEAALVRVEQDQERMSLALQEEHRARIEDYQLREQEREREQARREEHYRAVEQERERE